MVFLVRLTVVVIISVSFSVDVLTVDKEKDGVNEVFEVLIFFFVSVCLSVIVSEDKSEILSSAVSEFFSDMIVDSVKVRDVDGVSTLFSRQDANEKSRTNVKNNAVNFFIRHLI